MSQRSKQLRRSRRVKRRRRKGRKRWGEGMRRGLWPRPNLKRGQQRLARSSGR